MATPAGLEAAVGRISELRHWLAKHRAPQSLVLKLDVETFSQPRFRR
jgi:hypothetical protein